MIILEKTKILTEKNREKFTLNKMSEKLNEIIESYTKHLSTEVGLNLPKLKKRNEKDGSKLKLPKLNKVTEGAL